MLNTYSPVGVRPVVIKHEQRPLLPSQPKLARRNSFEHCRSKFNVTEATRPKCSNDELSLLKEELQRVKNDFQRSEQQRDELERKLTSSKREIMEIRLNYDTLVRERERVLQENLSIHTLQEENQRLMRENASVKKEFTEQLDSLTTERVSLHNQVDGLMQDKEQQNLTIQQQKQDLEEKRQEFEEFRRVNEKLLQESQQREQCLQNELKKLKSPSQPCPRPECMQLRADKAKLTKRLEKKCERYDCVKAKADLDKAEKRIKQMERKTCNSPQCKNQELKSMNDAIGPKICIEGQAYSHSEVLGFLVQRMEVQHTGGDTKSLHAQLRRLQLDNQQLQQQLSEAIGNTGSCRYWEGHLICNNKVVNTGGKVEFPTFFTERNVRAEKRECRNEACRATKATLQRKAEEIQQKFYAEKCPRPDCQKFHDRLKSIEFEAQGKGRSPAKDVSIMCGGDHDVVLQDFDELFSDINSDGILGVLESCLEQIEAKRLLCEIFQYAYEACKEASLKRIRHTLEALFVVCDKRRRKSDLGDASRAYGLLLHMSGLKEDESVCRDISLQIPTAFSESESYKKASEQLSVNQECLMKVLKVAWKFVTLPSPIIARQPSHYIPQNVDREYGYWDDSTPDAQLIYTRPVVYRCYDGKRAIKGMVANTCTEKCLEEPSKGIIERATDFAGFVKGVVWGGHGESEPHN